MPKFCPKCGWEIEKGTFCEECRELELEYKELKVKLCPSYRYYHKGKWAKFSDLRTLTEKLIKSSFKDNVKVIEGLEKYEYLLEKPGLTKKIPIVIEYNEEPYEVEVEVSITYSPQVAKLGTDYYEGILQLRNASNEAKRYLKKQVEGDKEDVYFNKVVDKGYNVDYYFVNKKHIRKFALKLTEHFGGYMEESAQHFSLDRQTSKAVYRLNIIVILPLFKEKDVIIFNEKLLYVKKLSKKVKALNLETGEEESFSFTKNFKDLKPYDKSKTVISKINPGLEGLDPETYESVSLENPLGLKVSNGKKVQSVKYKNKLYLVNN